MPGTAGNVDGRLPQDAAETGETYDGEVLRDRTDFAPTLHRQYGPTGGEGTVTQVTGRIHVANIADCSVLSRPRSK